MTTNTSTRETNTIRVLVGRRTPGRPTALLHHSTTLGFALVIVAQQAVMVDALFGNKAREEAREEAERAAREAEEAAAELERQEEIVTVFGMEFDKTAFWIITGILSAAGVAYAVYLATEKRKQLGTTAGVTSRAIGDENFAAAAVDTTATDADAKASTAKPTTTATPDESKDTKKPTPSVDTEKLKQDAKKAATQAYAGAKYGVKVGSQVASDSMERAKAFVMDGPVPFRALMFGGGCAVLVAAIRDMVEEVFIYDFYQTFASVFNLGFGILIILLESTALFRRTPWRKTLYDNAAFLKTTFGRGFFYVFIGINMGSQNFGPFSSIVAIYVLVLGVTAVVVGYWTQRKVTKLRATLKDADMVKETFEKMDTNNDGALDQEEFAALCESLGVPMKKVELLAIFDVLDTSEVNQKKNTITYEEFKTWWTEWDEFSEVI